MVFAIATLIMLILSLGIGSGMSLKGTLLKMTLLPTLLVIWLVGVLVIRMRDQRELQREIDELNEIERVSR